MQKLGELSSWTPVREGESLEFPSDRTDARLVRLEVNSAAPMSLYISRLRSGGAISKDDSVEFLCKTDALDKVEFFYPGSFRLVVEGNGYVRTMDGAMVHVLKTDDRVFATIAERNPVDYRLQLAMRIAAENAEKRIAQLVEERERLRHENEEPEVVNTPPSTAKPARKKPAGAAPEAHVDGAGGDDDGAGE